MVTLTKTMLHILTESIFSLGWRWMPFNLKRHKLNGIDFPNMGKCCVVTFLLELSDRLVTNDRKVGDDLIKLSRNSVHVLNATSNHLYNRFTLRTYYCHYSNKTVSFESLTLVNNATYVRQSRCQSNLPKNGRELEQLLKDMSKVFSWRNGVLQLACQLEKAAADESTLSSIFLNTGSPPSNQ